MVETFAFIAFIFIMRPHEGYYQLHCEVVW